MKHNIILPLAAFAFLLGACGGGDDGASTVTNEARSRAEASAAYIIKCDSAASYMKLQESVLAAKALQSQYLLQGDTAAADTFDVAFRQYMEAHSPQLASQLFNASTARKR